MAKIQITPELLKSQADELEKLANEYDDLSKRVNTSLVGINECWSMMLSRNCLGKISSAKRSVDEVATMLHSGSKAAAHSAETFSTIDSAIAKEVDPNYQSTGGGIGIGASAGVAATVAAEVGGGFWTAASSLWNKFTTGVTTGAHSVWQSENGVFSLLTGELSANGDGFGGFKDKYKPVKRKDIPERTTDKDKVYYVKDEDGNKKYISEEEAGFYKKGATLLEVSATAQASGSVFSISGESESGWSGSVDVLSAEAHATASAGLYVYKTDKDGNKIKKLAPSASVEVGASVTALDLKGSTPTVGNELLGGSLSGEVKAGVASAKADAGVGFVGGKFQASASASAEAIAGEAKATANVNVLGGEHKVSAGVNFGIGAHADVGYRDGKFKCDLGASVGLGVSINVEVDVVGTAKTVGKAVGGAAKGAYNWVKGFF